MGNADDFLKQLLDVHPEILDGDFDLDALNKLIERQQNRMNSGPINDFDGLSPEQMNFLLYMPFSPECMLRVRPNINAHVEEVPFLQLSEILINEIHRTGSVKLTTIGNLPVRICEVLFQQDVIDWNGKKYLKKVREDEIPYIWPLKQYLLDFGLAKKRHNTLSLTKAGLKMRKDAHDTHFVNILRYFVQRLNWGNFYHIEDGGRYGQLGWAFSLVLLSRYGDTPRESQFYSQKLYDAFERNQICEDQEARDNMATSYFHHAYQVRFFETFANWFGLVNIERKNNTMIGYGEQLFITKSALFDKLFAVHNE